MNMRRCPRGVIAAVLSILFVESTLSRHDLELTRPEGINLRMARFAARTHAPGRDLLCLGSSMVQGGILPAVLDRHSGSKSYNLAVVAGTTSTSYYLLKEALNAGARPSAVVLDLHPVFILADNRDRNHFWSDSLGLIDLIDLAWTLNDSHLFSEILFTKSLRSLYHRDQLRTSLLGALNGASSTHWYGNLVWMRNLNRNQGAAVSENNPVYKGEVTPVYQSLWLSDEHRKGSSPSAELYMHRLLKLAAAHGIRVYWVNMPLVPELEHEREAKGWNKDYDRFTRKFSSYANLVVLDARNTGYPPSVFLDATHLASSGANALSRDIAQVLSRDKIVNTKDERSRRVLLPPFQQRPIDVPFESLAHSMRALLSPKKQSR